jgi:hypothetical protein
MECKYDEMVGNTREMVENILGHLELDWEDGCLDFTKTERAVHTASSSQVRKPIYRQSVDRWKRYEPFMRKFLRRIPPKLG